MENPKGEEVGPRQKPFRDFLLKNGTVIKVFQGSRGEKPDLDIIVKYQEKGKRDRTPQHTHWAIDLLIKKEHEPELTKKFISFLLNMWNLVRPFSSKEEQQKCELKFSSYDKLGEFSLLDKYGEYSVEFIAKIMELIMIQEKTGNKKAFMFKKVLESIRDDKDIFSIVSSAGYRGR